MAITGPLGSPEHPLRVAIVGSGPAGFYAAAHLEKAGLSVQIEMLDRLPTPWGLVRAGVAPDHPKIKQVSRVYETIASHPGFRFHGNIEVGRDITAAELLAHHHAVVYATGTLADRRLGISGEDLPGSHAATEFVGWYNGHPDFRDCRFDLSCERAVVVGNGNVALDLARMLALTDAELRVTDTADHALEALAASRIREIVILGRRGPAQASFTTPELRELVDLADADIIVDPDELVAGESAQRSGGRGGDDAAVQRNLAVLAGYARRAPAGRGRRIVFRFLTSPVEILGTARVEALRVVRNELVRGEDGALRARPTADEEVIPTGLVLRSVGYRGTAIDDLPFDERQATIPNRAGRVIDPRSDESISGMYVAGWIKRGPTGVIGTNKKCSQETVEHLLEDLAAGRLADPAGDAAALEKLIAERQPDAVTYAGWQLIDRHERALGEPLGRPRVKLTRIGEMLEHLRRS